MPRQGLLHISENRRFGVQEKRMSDGKITIKSESQRALMRAAGELTGRTLNYIETLIKPGISTKELDEAAEEFIRSHGAVPSFLNYEGFPASICTSVNDRIVHGIPSRHDRLRDGDIISVDCGALLNGFHGDAARTFLVGNVAPEVAKLVQVTKECFFKGLEQAVVGNHISDIGRAIQQHAESHGYGVVRELVGHGIGMNMHEAPEVPNFGTPGRGIRLLPGMTIAIEPMVNAGGYDVKVQPDGWTVLTKDGSLSAHFEHTIVITADGPKIMTVV